MPDEPPIAAPTTLPAEWQSVQDVPVVIYDVVEPIAWPDRTDLIELAAGTDAVLATVLVALGAAAALYGYRMYRGLAALALAGLGVWGGWLVAKPYDATTAGMMLGGVVAAAAAWPSARLSVALCGGIVGAVIGGAAWRALGLADAYTPAGATIGLVFLVMLVFVSLRAAAILTFGTLGVVLLLGGLLGLLMRYGIIADLVHDQVASSPVLLPAILLMLVVVCSFVQQAWAHAIDTD